MEEAGLKNIPFERTAPSEYVPRSSFYQWAGLGNNTTPTREELGKKNNSYKWQNVETKRRPAITRRTPCSDNQTLKLHHVRAPTLSKRERRLGAEYDTDRQRKVVIYKET